MTKLRQPLRKQINKSVKLRQPLRKQINKSVNVLNELSMENSFVIPNTFESHIMSHYVINTPNVSHNVINTPNAPKTVKFIAMSTFDIAINLNELSNELF